MAQRKHQIILFNILQDKLLKPHSISLLESIIADFSIHYKENLIFIPIQPIIDPIGKLREGMTAENDFALFHLDVCHRCVDCCLEYQELHANKASFNKHADYLVNGELFKTTSQLVQHLYPHFNTVQSFNMI